MFEQYPHTCTIRYYAEPTQNTDGDIVTGATTTLTSVCRIKPISESWTNAETGIETKLIYTVSMPLLSGAFVYGEVDIEGKTYPVKRIYHYQLRTKIWV